MDPSQQHPPWATLPAHLQPHQAQQQQQQPRTPMSARRPTAPSPRSGSSRLSARKRGSTASSRSPAGAGRSINGGSQTARAYPLHEQFVPSSFHQQQPPQQPLSSTWPATHTSDGGGSPLAAVPPFSPRPPPSSLSSAQMAALLAAPLSPRVAQAVRAHRAALAGDPLAMVHAQQQQQQQAQLQVEVHMEQKQQHHSPPLFTTHTAMSQLQLPLEFVQQQQQKLLAQQHAQFVAEGRQDDALTATLLASTAGHTRGLSVPSFPANQQQTSPRMGRAAGRSPVRPGTSAGHTHANAGAAAMLPLVQYVAAELPDLGYENRKKRADRFVDQLAQEVAEESKKKKERMARVQLEMRGSVRFDTSNPERIFASLRAQAAQPVQEVVDYNAKRVVRLKDGSLATVFGSVLSRTDTVRDGALSSFFVQRSQAALPTLEKFALQNFAADARVTARDVKKAEAHNKESKHYEHKARVERTEEELLACSDDVLSKLERWKRDQLRLKLAKAEANAEASRIQAERAREALKLRLERERFEREEREAREKELAALAAREDEERRAREEESMRLYRETLGAEAQSIKQARLDAEAAKHAEEEAEKARAAAELARRKKMQAEGYVPTFMSPLHKEGVGGGVRRERTQADEVLIGRMKDTEKDWKLAMAKLKAEVVRLNELVRKRDKAAAAAAASAAALLAQQQPDHADVTVDIRALRRSGLLTPPEAQKLKELEAVEVEHHVAMEKAAAAWEAAEAAHAAAHAAAQQQRNMVPKRKMVTVSAGASETNSGASSTMGSPTASHANLRNLTSRDGMNLGGGGGTLMEGEEHDGGEGDHHSEDGGSSAASSVRASRRATRRRSLKFQEPVPGTRSSSSSSMTMPGTAGGQRATLARVVSSGSRVGSTETSRAASKAGSKAGSRRHSITSEDEIGGGGGGPRFDGSSMNASSAAAGAASAGRSGATSGAVTPTPGSGSGGGDGGGGGTDDPIVEVGEDGEEVYVNEKTLAIDAARQAMVSQQLDFEARIKALTSFSSVPAKGKGKAGASKKKRTTAAKPPAGSSSAGSSSSSGVARKKNSILVPNSGPPPASAANLDDSDDDGTVDERLARSLAQTSVAE